jgi:hypothetical protein
MPPNDNLGWRSAMFFDQCFDRWVFELGTLTERTPPFATLTFLCATACGSLGPCSDSNSSTTASLNKSQIKYTTVLQYVALRLKRT